MVSDAPKQEYCYTYQIKIKIKQLYSTIGPRNRYQFDLEVRQVALGEIGCTLHINILQLSVPSICLTSIFNLLTGLGDLGTAVQ